MCPHSMHFGPISTEYSKAMGLLLGEGSKIGFGFRVQHGGMHMCHNVQERHRQRQSQQAEYLIVKEGAVVNHGSVLYAHINDPKP